MVIINNKTINSDVTFTMVIYWLNDNNEQLLDFQCRNNQKIFFVYFHFGVRIWPMSIAIICPFFFAIQKFYLSIFTCNLNSDLKNLIRTTLFDAIGPLLKSQLRKTCFSTAECSLRLLVGTSRSIHLMWLFCVHQSTSTNQFLFRLQTKIFQR